MLLFDFINVVYLYVITICGGDCGTDRNGENGVQQGNVMVVDAWVVFSSPKEGIPVPRSLTLAAKRRRRVTAMTWAIFVRPSQPSS